MPWKPVLHRPAGAKPAAEVKRELDRQRPSATQRGYDARWRKARARYLAEHPLCASCQAEGRLTPATVVDHIVPHRGDTRLFWDETNWAVLCKRCHDRKTVRDGRWGRQANVRRRHGCDIHGMPLDPEHPWNRQDPRGAGGGSSCPCAGAGNRPGPALRGAAKFRRWVSGINQLNPRDIRLFSSLNSTPFS
jgi:5-methylcytosine-specific restriction enzyme A